MLRVRDLVHLMTIDYQGLVTQGLARQISEKIRDAILEGRIQVHERLPTEEELAAKFNVSRPTIREALKRLAAQNLIRSRRGPTGGTFVNQPRRSPPHGGQCGEVARVHGRLRAQRHRGGAAGD
jgi:DNA-binding GntR family transcriptional regulator